MTKDYRHYLAVLGLVICLPREMRSLFHRGALKLGITALAVSGEQSRIF